MPDDTNKSKSEQPEEAGDEAERDPSGNGCQIETSARTHDAKNVPWWIDSKVQTKQVGAKHGYTDR